MNEKKAKALRREIYGDFYLRQKRHYVRKMDGMIVTRTIENHPSSLRAIYQRAKKAEAAK